MQVQIIDSMCLDESSSRSQDPQMRELLVFDLGEEQYGIPIQKVQELRGYDSVTRIAHASEYIKGVINLRGIIVPIIDMRIKFNLGPPTYDVFTVVIILNVANFVVGIVVDGVSDVVTLRHEQIKTVPEMRSFVMDADYLEGIGTIEDRMLIMVNIDKLISQDVLATTEEVAA